MLWWEELLDNLATKEGVKGISLKEILAFITGAEQVPPSGFPKTIEILFFDRPLSGVKYPYTSTCALQFFIPKGVENYEEMENLIRESLKCGQGFGNV